MKPFRRIHRWLFAPLVYLAALLLMLEDWLWDRGATLMRWLTAWPPLRRLEDAICRLGPYAALVLLVLPATLLFPVKLLALWAIANGHPVLGVVVIAATKVIGAALVARLYLLTRPVLMTIVWFARLLGWFLVLKQRWIARLHATRAWRRVQAMASAVRRWRKGWQLRWQQLWQLRRQRRSAAAPRSWTARFRRLLKRVRARLRPH